MLPETRSVPLSPPLPSRFGRTGFRRGFELRLALGLATAFTLGLPSLTAGEPAATDERLARIMAELVSRNEQRLTDLSRYTSRRRYVIENKRFGQSASVEVIERYEHPGRKEFEIVNEEGSSYVQKIVHKMLDAELESAEDDRREETQVSAAQYEFKWVEETELDGRPVYVIEIDPRKKKSFLIKGRIWVDAREMAIVRMEGALSKKPSFWVGRTNIIRTYSKHGPFWLPASMESISSIMLAGKSSLVVDYYDYEIVQADGGPIQAAAGLE